MTDVSGAADAPAEAPRPPTPIRFPDAAPADASRDASYHLARGLWLLATRLVLARLVSPLGHGLFDLAFQIVVLVSVVRDLGVPRAVLQLRREPPYGVVAAWSAGLGAVLAILLALVAHWSSGLLPVVSQGPNAVGVPEVLRVLALWVFLDALTTAPRAALGRAYPHLGSLAGWIAEAVRAVAFTGIAVALAGKGWGVWSLVAGELASTALLAVMLWIAVARRVPWRLERSRLGQVVATGAAWMALPVLLQVLARADVLLVGWFADARAVGFYGRAHLLAFVATLLVAPRLLGPALMRLRNDPERLSETFRLGSAVLAMAPVVTGYLLYWNAETVVRWLLGGGWDEAVPLLRLLAFVPFLDAFALTGAELLKIRREEGWWLAVTALDLVALVAVASWWGPRLGASGVAWALFAVPGHALLLARLVKVLGPGMWRAVGSMAVVYLLPLPLFGAAVALTEAGSAQRLGASLLAAAVSLALLAWRYLGAYRRRVRSALSG